MREISRVIDTVWDYFNEGEDTLLEGWRTVTFERCRGKSDSGESWEVVHVNVFPKPPEGRLPIWCMSHRGEIRAREVAGGIHLEWSLICEHIFSEDVESVHREEAVVPYVEIENASYKRGVVFRAVADVGCWLMSVREKYT